MVTVLALGPLGAWVYRVGWSAVPTPVIVALWPWGDSFPRLGSTSRMGATTVDDELHDRIATGSKGWTASVMLWQCRRAMRVGVDAARQERAIEIVQVLSSRNVDVKSAEPGLLAMVQHGKPPVDSRAFSLACSLSPMPIGPDICDQLKTRAMVARCRRAELSYRCIEAAQYLAIHHVEQSLATTTAIEHLRSSEFDTVREAAGLLGKLPATTDGVGALAMLVTVGGDLIAAHAAWSLGDLGRAAEAGVPELIDRLLDASSPGGGAYSSTKMACVRSLGKIGGKAVTGLPAIAAAAADDPRLNEDCDRAIAALGGGMDEGAVALLGMVERGELRRRGEAVRAVCVCGARTEEVLESARRLGRDADPDVAKWANRIVGGAK